jgi:thioredoxin reductase (NADPH)
MAEHYDMVVIGGGSGGLACSKEAAKFGKNVALLDFVKPTPIGTKWGLGGTCVNVGCIPKKLMHYTAILGEHIDDANKYGWAVDETNKKHNWEKMVEGVQDHIGSLNWGYRTSLRSNGVKYLNEFGSFVDANTIECTNKKGEKRKITADTVVVAVGGRPKYMGLPNEQELCITSDDLFSMSSPPGKTLVVGASYVALENAGFIAGLGYDTTVMVRSILLRGFDQQMANHIGGYMESHGVKFIRKATPTAFEKGETKKVKVKWTDPETNAEVSDEFDTVLIAVGRYAVTADLNLANAGIEVDKSHKIIGVEDEQTNVKNVYALGDCLHNPKVGAVLELTPVAIQAGVLLARRLYGGANLKMDYSMVPTTVFTPIEYGSVGMSEEEALEKYGQDGLEVFHAYFQPLEFTVAKRGENECYGKVLVEKATDKIVGMHICGIHAGEIIQGFGLALKLGATKAQLDNLVGIHPTSAEEFTTMSITKSSGIDAQK